MSNPATVIAAGGVVWRESHGSRQVLLVHRPRYDDWSLPKGKLNPREHVLVAARREIEEETGQQVLLGPPLGIQRYDVRKNGGTAPKLVRYWAASLAGPEQEFEPNDEVDKLEWLAVDQAQERLSYPRDVDILNCLDAVLPVESTVVVLRHAAAVKRKDMTPTDVALLDEAHWLIDPSFRRFGHVVVDEAQNLTPMELRMTVRRARGQSLTILGDLSQRTADAGVSSWEAVLSEAGVGDHAVSELNISYRVPNDFLVLAGALLPPGAPAPRGVRDAPFPAVAVETDDVGATAARLAARMAEEVGSVGVVTPLESMKSVRAALTDFVDATSGAALGAGVNLIDLHVAKGLEFDAIVVVEPAAILAERPDGGVGGLYTALTRSTRALAIVHAQPLPETLLNTNVLRTETDRNRG